MRRRPRLSEAQQRNAVVSDGDLVALTQHPGWEQLLAMIEEQSRALERVVINNTMRGKGPIKPDAILESRGFLKGMNFIVQKAAGAQHRLEDALQQEANKRTEEAS